MRCSQASCTDTTRRRLRLSWRASISAPSVWRSRRRRDTSHSSDSPERILPVSLTLYFALLLLTPVFFALVIAALGFARQPIPWLVGVCAALGVALPLAGLIFLNIANSSGVPLQITLLGEAGSKVLWAMAYRVDAI